MRRRELAVQIKHLVGERKSLSEIATVLSRSESWIRDVSYQEDISLERIVGRRIYSREGREMVAKKIQMLLGEGKVRSREELASLVGVSPRFVGNYGIELPSTLEPYRWRPDLDTRIDAGETVNEMGQALGITRQAVHDYIQRSGQRAFWHERRRERREKEKSERFPEKQQTLELIAGQVLVLVEKRANEGTWAEQMAYAYHQQRGHHGGYQHLPLEQLISAFQVYEEAQQRGERVTRRELARRANLIEHTLGDIYKKMRLPKIYTERIVLSVEKRAVMNDVFSLEMTAQDIGYFWDISFPVIIQRRAKQGILVRAKHLYILSSKSGKIADLTYRLASQIYEAVDLGFTGEETQQLLSTPERELHPKILDYALQYRLGIEQTIIHALDTMFPEKKHEKPYR